MRIVQVLSNADGQEYERIEYTPYGELWIEKASTASNIDIPYRFTGKERDEETGLYYYGARYLDSKASRWLSTDPALGDYIPGAPVNDEARKRNQSLPGLGGVFNLVNLHLYHYAGNNPVKYIDPDGNDFNSFIFNILFGLMNGDMPTSDTFNEAFPSSNPGIVAYNYAKADQSHNPFTVGESLKAGYKPLSPEKAALHRQGEGSEYNIKMVHQDGREAIYNKEGNLVTDQKILEQKMILYQMVNSLMMFWVMAHPMYCHI
jgi:RHS repeat-associated protein